MTFIDSGVEVKYLVRIEPLPEYRLYVEFQDGLAGEVDISKNLHGPMFEPLKDPEFFNRVSLDDYGAPFWPNEADLAPDMLYEKLKSLKN